MPLASHNKRTDGPVHSQLGTPGGGGGWREMVGDDKEEEDRDEEEVGKNGEDWEEEEEEGKSRVWYIYSTNNNSRPSKKRTTSLQWKSLMPPTDNPIDLSLKKPPRDGRPKQETLAMARTDLS